MNIENTIKLFIKIFCMNLCIELSIIKILNYKSKIRKINIVIINLAISMIYAILREKIIRYIDTTLIDLFIYFIMGICTISQINIKNLFVVIMAISFAYISYLMSISINFFITKFTISGMARTDTLAFIIVGILQLILISLFFKIKRFKHGFSFFKKENSNGISNILGMIISIAIIVMCVMYSTYKTDLVATMTVIGIALGGIVMIYWIKRKITEYYKKQMKDRTVEIQAKELKEKDEIINNLKEELAGVLKINHKYSHRIAAAQNSIIKFGEKLNLKGEFAEEYADILDNIKKLAEEYKTENILLSTNNTNLPKTNIYSIDNLLSYMKDEANKYNISLELKVNNNINSLVDNVISKSKLETLLGDHIKDAIIAINSSNNTYKNILVVIEILDECYEIRIYDTGIEFKIETLLKLGLEPITTHKENGGSGIGFMTTFETLKETKASLIIEEKHKMKNNDYTKTIIIRFDGKEEYKIRSYRAETIENICNDSRIIIEKL